MDSMLFAKFIGRTLAHELGHVLLNSRGHPEVGLMRGRYRLRDVHEPVARSYTLGSAERAVLLAAARRDATDGPLSGKITRPSVLSYRFGPFRLVPEQRRLDRDGAPVALTPKAFDLLVALVRHRARALSKDEVFAMVWPGAVVEEGNLAQQVLLLRRALAEAGDAVSTIPRHGYRFVAPVLEEHEAHDTPVMSPHCLVWDNRQFPLMEGITTIGRADGSDVQILLPSLSRHHARIVVRGMEATVEDLGSRHGTWRGTTRVQAPMALVTGDEVRVGTAVLVYRLVLPGDTTAG
jgi:DNA-binding winged helix-turn-helix (wHTH) protein